MFDLARCKRVWGTWLARSSAARETSWSKHQQTGRRRTTGANWDTTRQGVRCLKKWRFCSDWTGLFLTGGDCFNKTDSSEQSIWTWAGTDETTTPRISIWSTPSAASYRLSRSWWSVSAKRLGDYDHAWQLEDVCPIFGRVGIRNSQSPRGTKCMEDVVEI